MTHILRSWSGNSKSIQLVKGPATTVFLAYQDSMACSIRIEGLSLSRYTVPDPLWQYGGSILNPVMKSIIFLCFNAVVTGSSLGLKD